MVLAIDYGRRRIGLALSDETETIAMVLKALSVNGKSDSIKKITETIIKYKIKQVIIGLPLGHDEKPTQMSKEILSFTKELKENVNIECVFWNETFTSNLARINSKKNIDSHSARIILQEYLDRKDP